MKKRMKKIQAWGGSLFVLIALASSAHGQEATERFVPIGQSPGQSPGQPGRTTTVGTVQAVDAQARSLTVGADGQSLSLVWTERTRFWLDRSRQQQGTLKGTASDIQIGRRVEVKPDKADNRRADWIKIDPATLP